MPSRMPYVWQQDAVDEIVHLLHSGRGVLCDGRTGCGKTLIAGLALKEYARKRKGATCAIALVPCLGGTVIKQWREELEHRLPEDGSMPVSVFVYRGPRRHKDLASFAGALASAIRDEVPGLFVVITTPPTLQSEGAQTLAQLPLSVGVIDEAHWCGSGSPSTSPVEVDVTKRRYAALSELHAKVKVAWLMLTATPVRNHATDQYSLARLGGWGCRKDNWLPHADESAFAKETAIVQKHTVHVKMPPEMCPPTSIQKREHAMAADEAHACAANWEELQRSTREFLRAISICIQIATPQNLEDKRRKQMAFESTLTRGRRGMLHPYFYADKGSPTALHAAAKRLESIASKGGAAEEMASAADAFQVQCLEAAEGPLRMSLSAGGKLAEAAEMLQVNPWDRSKQKLFEKALNTARRSLGWREWREITRRFPLRECSKMSATVDLLRELRDRKVLVLAFYAEPLDLLECYLKEALPGRPIQVHHGKRDMPAAMDMFRAADAPVIMLATRGSVGEGVSIEWTYPQGTHAVVTLRLDAARTVAEERQCEGRMKRPLAQPGVDKWFCHDIRIKDAVTIETWLERVQAIKGQRAKVFAGEDSQGENEEADREEEGLDSGVLQTLLRLGLGDLDRSECDSTPPAKRQKHAQQHQDTEEKRHVRKQHVSEKAAPPTGLPPRRNVTDRRDAPVHKCHAGPRGRRTRGHRGSVAPEPRTAAAEAESRLCEGADRGGRDDRR